MNIPKYQKSSVDGALRQGELLSNVSLVVPTSVSRPDIHVAIKIHKTALIVSQDCDLDHDYIYRLESRTKSKELPYTLLCPVYVLADRVDEVLNQAGIKRKKAWELFRNDTKRYYAFEVIPPEKDFHGKGLPELVVDFKHYFSVPTAYLYESIEKNVTLRRSTLVSPYLEHFMQKFVSFQGRVATPEQYKSQDDGV